ncbi:unnamed protein product [Protopolystoma xenopodis]|uniref:Uncharacterized protein n=1 Tax=Protopolystoma xenopodis TaxID=117903 RepID=A0A3S5FGR0_9PLAT|nr:unnamed protein product [Protopolystoma xenopodis]
MTQTNKACSTLGSGRSGEKGGRGEGREGRGGGILFELSRYRSVVMEEYTDGRWVELHRCAGGCRNVLQELEEKINILFYFAHILALSLSLSHLHSFAPSTFLLPPPPPPHAQRRHRVDRAGSSLQAFRQVVQTCCGLSGVGKSSGSAERGTPPRRRPTVPMLEATDSHFKLTQLLYLSLSLSLSHTHTHIQAVWTADHLVPFSRPHFI